MRKVKLSEITLDYKVYPRKEIRVPHVANLKDAIEAGEELPPIVIEKGTGRIVDGFHRFEAYKALLKPSAMIPVVEKRYKNDAELFLDSIRLNSEHGLALDRWAKAKCAQKCRDLGLDDKAIAKALRMSVDRIQAMLEKRTARSRNGKVVLKGSLQFLRGKKLTERQVKANEKVGGFAAGYYVKQVLTFLRGDVIDRENENLMELLQELYEELGSFLAE